MIKFRIYRLNEGSARSFMFSKDLERKSRTKQTWKNKAFVIIDRTIDRDNDPYGIPLCE